MDDNLWMLRQLREQHDDTEALLWAWASAYLDFGADPDKVAAAMGVSRATLYRKRLPPARPV